MLTLTRTPLGLLTNTHYAMGRDARAGKRVARVNLDDLDENQNEERRDESSFLDDDFAFRTKGGAKAGLKSGSKSGKASGLGASGAATAKSTTTATTSAAAETRTNGVNGSSSKNATNKRKQAYDEDDDGFTFTRAKIKRAKPSPAPVETTTAKSAGPGRSRAAKVAEEIPEAISEEDSLLHDNADTQAKKEAPRRGRRKRSPEPSVPAPAPTEEQQQQQQQPAKRRPGRPPKIPRSPGDEQDVPPLQVEKKRRQKSPMVDSQARTQQRHQGHDATDTRPSEQRRTKTPPVAGTTKIALPFADTPIIRKNQEMRRRASGVARSDGSRDSRSGRRSSLGQRGRRASSLIDSGRSSALPHDAVDSAEFFKHIEAGLPPPRRMRQLLTWCATRALADARSKDGGAVTGNKKGAGGSAAAKQSEDSTVRLAAREIQNQILKDFGLRSDMSDWYSRPEEVESGRETVLKKPNPRNEANEKKIRELETQLRRLQSERATWESLLKPQPQSSATASPPSSPQHDVGILSAIPSLRIPPTLPDFAKLDTAHLTTSNAAVLDSLRRLELRTAPVLQDQTRRRLDAAASGLAFDVDRLADSAHVLGRFRVAAGRVAARVLEDAGAALELRSRAERERSGAPERPVRDILRGLSRVENR